MTGRRTIEQREALQARDQEILDQYEAYLKDRVDPVDEAARRGFASSIRQQKGYSDYDDERILALIGDD